MKKSNIMGGLSLFLVLLLLLFVGSIELNTVLCDKAEGTPSGMVRATAINNGDGECVSMALSCPTPFSSTQSAQSICLENGQSELVTFQYNVQTSNDQCNTCNIELSSTTGVRKYAVNCCASPIKDCMNPGETKCEGHKIYSCEKGMWVLSNDCMTSNQKCGYENDKMVCVPEDNTSQSSPFPLNLVIFGAIVCILLILLVGLLLFILGILRKKEKERPKK
jgi:hypothetical protein